MYFGTDGIRAREEFFNDEFLERFANALFLKYGSCNVCIARDTRISGERIGLGIAERLIEFGFRVFDCGVVPTPVLAFLTKANDCKVGIMISASHNPPEYNGLKLFSGLGEKIGKLVEEELEELFSRPTAFKTARKGKICLLDSSEYEKYLATTFGNRLKGMRVLIDTGHGATSKLAKRVFCNLGCMVECINNDYDGIKINVECGATCLTPVLEAYSKGYYDVAFSYDGDGDRVMCVKDGKVYNGDHVVYAYARYLDKKRELSPRMVVGTLNSNLGLEKALESRGIKLIRAEVGDKNVREEMLNNEVKIGGESSGHVIFDGYSTTGDGILTSLMVCLMEKEIGFEELVDMVDYPVEETFVYADERAKSVFKEGDRIKEKIMRLEKNGVRVVVRPSGTEPKIRVLVEAERYETAREKANEIKKIIECEINENIDKKGDKNINLDNQNTIFKKANYEVYTARGVTIISPETTFIEEGVKIGEGSIIYPFNVIRGDTEIANNVTIYSYCDLTDTIVLEGADVRSSYCMQAVIGENSTIGPFATLRKGAIIGKGCRIGDYVEVKNSILGDGVKSAHLSYIGDAQVGARTNVGCGTVFANYNGKIKRKIEVGEGVFIGCNSNLIAPLKIGDNAYIAGGATITEDIPNDKFVISRVCQKVKDKR